MVPPLPSSVGLAQDTPESKGKVFLDPGSKRSIVYNPESTDPVLQALQNIDTAIQLAPDYKGIIPPVLDYNAGSQDNSSALRQAPSSSSPASTVALRSLPSALASTTNLQSTARDSSINIYHHRPGTPFTLTTVESHCRKGTRGHRSSRPVGQRCGT